MPHQPWHQRLLPMPFLRQKFHCCHQKTAPNYCNSCLSLNLAAAIPYWSAAQPTAIDHAKLERNDHSHLCTRSCCSHLYTLESASHSEKCSILEHKPVSHS